MKRDLLGMWVNGLGLHLSLLLLLLMVTDARLTDSPPEQLF